MKNMAVLFYAHKQRVIFLLAVVLVSAAFLIGHDVLAAGDDNLTVPSCADLHCDGDEDTCIGEVANDRWLPFFYPDGNPSCCGDDSEEPLAGSYLLSCQRCFNSPADNGVSCDAAKGCVGNDDEKCVFGGNAINSVMMGIDTCSSYPCGVDTNDSSGDIEICYDRCFIDQDYSDGYYCTNFESVSDNDVWFSSSSLCKSAGPSGVCDDSDGGSFCCGDDANEKSVSSCSGPANSACCPSTANYVDASGNCVASCPHTPTFWPGSTCTNLEDVNSSPAVGVGVFPYCSFNAEECEYRIYKNSVNNFNSASIISTTRIIKNTWGDYVTEDDYGFFSIINSEIIPNTQYFFWVAEYDTSNKLIIKTDSKSAYSGRTGKVTNLYSEFKYTDLYNAGILWQWDNYPGATAYEYTELESFVLPVYVSLPPHNSVALETINYYHLTSVFDTNKPFYLAHTAPLTPYTERTRTLIIRPRFESYGTIACGPDAAKEITNYPAGDVIGVSNLQHTSNTTNSITWTWSFTGTVNGYRIYNSAGQPLGITNGTEFTWSNLQTPPISFANKQYGIKVQAYNNNGSSDFTAVNYAFTSIEQPTSMTCSAASKTSLTVTANGTISNPDPDEPFNDYEKKINFSANDGATYSGWQTSVSKAFSALTCGTNYAIKAKTRNGDGEETSPVSTSCSTSPCNDGPDLIIQNINSLTSVCQGQIVDVTVTVKNIGNQTTGQTHKTKVYIDSEATGEQIMDNWTAILIAGATANEIVTWSTASAAIGYHNIIAIADAPLDSRINEANEDNNEQEKSINIVDCGEDDDPDPDFNNPPSGFDLLTPANGATGVSTAPTFTWENATDPEKDILSYHLYLAPCPGNNCAGVDPLASDPDGPDIAAANSLNKAGLLANTSYSWNVRVTDGENVTVSNNGPYTFTVGSGGGVGGTPPVASYEWCKVTADTAQFIDNSTVGDSPITSWEWTFNDGTDSVNTQHVLHTFGDTPFESPQFVWYSTLDNPTAIITPIPGPGVGGGILGTTTFIESLYGEAMLVDANGEGSYFPTSGGNFNKAKGAIQFFFQPLYNSNTVGEPNHYFYRADGPSGDSWELKFQNAGFYYKIYDNDGATQQCILSAVNITPGWTAGEWLKIVAMWDENEDKLRLYVYDGETDALRNSYSANCTINFSSAITLGNMYIGNSWVGGTYELDGAIDEFMVFNDDVYTLTGGTDNFTVTLTVTDEESDIDSETKTITLTDAPDCKYLMTNAAAYNCEATGLTWAHPAAWTPISYDVYRSASTGCATDPDNPTLCVWSLLKTQDKSIGALYDDTTVKQNTRYYYYLSANPIDQHNSYGACDGGLGVGTKICPMSVLVPVCPMEIAELSATHRCGVITLRWSTASGAKAYEIEKSPSGTANFSTLLLVNADNMATYCPTGEDYCTYEDKEIVPITTFNPTETQKYYYHIKAQGEDDSWSEWSTPIGDFSYCYRPRTWQER